jgi:hypothetical protein
MAIDSGGTADISRSPMGQLLSYKERLYWINSFCKTSSQQCQCKHVDQVQGESNKGGGLVEGTFRGCYVQSLEGHQEFEASSLEVASVCHR